MRVMDVKRIRDQINVADYEVEPHDYWLARMEIDAEMPVLFPQRKPCKDCAVVCGLYSEISKSLALEPAEIREFLTARWFCHNNRRRACAGNVQLIKALNP
jgi:hypothetical protein